MTTNLPESKLKSKIDLGIDIGGTKIKAIALEYPCKIVAETVAPSRAGEGPEAVKAAVLETIAYFNSTGISYENIGMGCAGSVDFHGGIVRNSPNFANWKNVPLRDWIMQATKKYCQIENDANCAVIAEWQEGNGKGKQNVVLLTLGTGIGGGLILNNQLFRGSTGTGGELGHFSIDANGIECPCGNRGCFERYCSATAVKGKAGGLSSKEIFVSNNSKECREIVAEFLRYFKVGLTGLVNIFDPDIVLLGGAVSESVATHKDEILDHLKKHAFPSVGHHVKIEKTKFGNLSGAMGAAMATRQSR